MWAYLGRNENEKNDCDLQFPHAKRQKTDTQVNELKQKLQFLFSQQKHWLVKLRFISFCRKEA